MRYIKLEEEPWFSRRFKIAMAVMIAAVLALFACLAIWGSEEAAMAVVGLLMLVCVPAWIVGGVLYIHLRDKRAKRPLLRAAALAMATAVALLACGIALFRC